MALIQKLLLIALILMSFAAGAAKLMQMPQEVAFFAAAGLGPLPLISLGVLQVAGAVFAIPHRWRRQGLWLMALGFLASSIVILITGNVIFAVGSLLPVILALYLSLPAGRTTG